MKKRSDGPELSEALLAGLGAKGKSQADLAKELGVPDSTVRQWVMRNVFPLEYIPEIAKGLGLPPELEKLQSKFKFTVARQRKATRTGARLVRQVNEGTASTSVPEAFRILEQRTFEQFGPSTPTMGQDVIFHIKALNSKDALIYWSLDQIPYEMRDGWAAAGPAIAQAIQKGADFIYLYPGDGLLDDLREHCGLRELPRASVFEGYFRDFCERLKRKQEVTQDEIDGHVISIMTNRGAFVAPGHKFVLYLPANDVPRGVARYPTAGNPNLAIHLPLGPETTQQFHEFIIACMQERKKALKKALDKALDKAPEDDSAERLKHEIDIIERIV
jgi:hypothetical protein